MDFYAGITDLEGALMGGGHDKGFAPCTTDANYTKLYCVCSARYLLQKSGEDAYQIKTGCVF